MELDSFLVSLYVLVDDWLRERHWSAQIRLGRPTLLSERMDARNCATFNPLYGNDWASFCLQ